MNTEVLGETATERTTAVPDEGYAPLSTFGAGFTDKDKEREAEEAKLIEANGVYGIIREKKCPACGRWETVDACWGFIPTADYTLLIAAEEHGLLVSARGEAAS